MVLIVASQSEIGRSFYINGPKKGLQSIESYLQRSIAAGSLKSGDAWVMAQQFVALLESELVPKRLYGVETTMPHESVVKAAVARAVDVFLAAYGHPPLKARGCGHLWRRL